MRRLGALLGLAVALAAPSMSWAGPFSEVPADHWAYRACARLEAQGVLSVPATGSLFSREVRLTRFEFGLALLDPLNALQRELRSLPSGADPVARVQAAARALRLNPSLSEEELSAIAHDLRLLGSEFSDVLGPLGFDAVAVGTVLQPLLDREAVRQWRARALSTSPLASAANPFADPGSASSGDTLRVPLAGGQVALTYQREAGSPEILDYFALSAADGKLGRLPGPLRAEAAPRDPQVSRLRTAYEYDLSSALRLSLAYEEIARRGHGLSPLDTAYLASLGVGYRFTPSTSVKLSYSVMEYSNYVFDTPRVRDTFAETSVTIAF